MDQRTSRKTIAEQTLKEIEQGYYITSSGKTVQFKDEVSHSIEMSRFQSSDMLENLLHVRTSSERSNAVTIFGGSTIQCLLHHRMEGKVGLLNFASAKNAGGGFLGGSQAQEESLARSSALYPTLLKNQEYYDINRRSSSTFYADNLIYSPEVVFFKDDEGVNLELFVKADVITMPAVNKGALKPDEKVQAEIDKVMKRRIRYVLAVAELNRVDTLILGAWGCGVFRNDPEDIAENFNDVLREKPSFDIPHIVFALLDKDGKTKSAFVNVLT